MVDLLRPEYYSILTEILTGRSSNRLEIFAFGKFFPSPAYIAGGGAGSIALATCVP